MHYRKHMSLVALVVAFTMIFTSCSTKLPEETLPPETTTTTTVEETSEETSETTIIEETAEEEETELVFSTAVVTERIVDNYGQLSVDGVHMVNEAGEPVQLKGMSTYGMNGMAGFVNADTVQTLAEDWGCDIIRMAMYTYSTGDAYNTNPDKYFNQMCEYIDLCIDQGVYVLVDWHILFDGDPNEYKDDAIDFFSRISAIYGDCPNVLYEICNEPNGPCFDNPDEQVGWDNCIRPYAEDVIAAIRANDPDNIIIVGTPNWSQDVDIASEHPLEDENVMYTVHFYAGSHGQDHRDKVQTAIDNGVAVFCTEWGTSMDSGTGGVHYEESLEWLDFFDDNMIGWCNWSIGGSVTESSNALKFVSNILTMEEKLAGHWPDEFISRSGLFVRAMILEQEFIIPED